MPNFKHISFSEKTENVNAVCSLRNIDVSTARLLGKHYNIIDITPSYRLLGSNLPRGCVVFEVLMKTNHYKAATNLVL